MKLQPIHLFVLPICLIIAGCNKPEKAQDELRPELIVPMTHLEGVAFIKFSPDGNLVLTGSEDRQAKLWDAKTGKLIRTYNGHIEAITAVAFSPDGETVLTASEDETARLWSIHDSKVKAVLSGHTESVVSAKFSPDGSKILTASHDGQAILWDSSGKRDTTLLSVNGELEEGIFSPDGKIVAVFCSEDSSSVTLVDPATRTIIRRIEKQDVVTAFSFDSKRMIVKEDSMIVVQDIATGKPIHSWKGIDDEMTMSEFSRDDKHLVTVTNSGVEVIDLIAKETAFSFLPDSTDILTYYNAGFSPDSKQLVIVGSEGIIIQNLDSAGYVFRINEDGVSGIDFNPASSAVAMGDWSGDFVILDLGPNDNPTWIRSTFSRIIEPRIIPGKNQLLITTNYATEIRDLVTGALIHSLSVPDYGISTIEFNPTADKVLISGHDSVTRVWDLESGKKLFQLPKHDRRVWSTNFSPDGKLLCTADSRIGIWDANSGAPIRQMKHASDAYSEEFADHDQAISLSKNFEKKSKRAFRNLNDDVANARFTPDSRYIVSSRDSTINVWDVSTGKRVHDLDHYETGDIIFDLSPDGKLIATGGDDSLVNIWNLQTGRKIRSFSGHKSDINSIRFSRASDRLISSASNCTVFTWNVNSGNAVYNFIDTLENKFNALVEAQISDNQETIVSYTYYGQMPRVWDGNGRWLRTIDLQGFEVVDVDFETGLILSLQNASVKVNEIHSGKELFLYTTMDSLNWALTNPSGLFDATQDAMNQMYFSYDLQTIDLNQLKDRYFEPGLWKKIMSHEKLRDISALDHIDLPPAIALNEITTDGQLAIELDNQNGGIGEVMVLINGKEVMGDARGPKPDSKAKSLSLSVPIKDHPYLLPGEKNTIEVRAWNGDHWVISRGAKVDYVPEKKDLTPPNVYVVAAGVSDYTGDAIDLKFAAKDAESMSAALRIASQRLFTAEKCFVYTLTTNKSQESWPTKENIVKVFGEISGKAKSTDILLLYLSGHGINWGGEKGDFYYLTQEARSASIEAYNDPSIRESATLSSRELIDLFKKVPALKQVLIIDACASGKVVDNLMSKRDISSSTLKQLDRMKDITGMHIITGCTADAVSYEASKYGQGVLTYSLIEAIRGARLKDGKFVDVQTLFQHAQDRVPELARGLGGIQAPQAFSPYGSQSFPIGEINEVDKTMIPLAKTKPVFMRSTFIDIDEQNDALEIAKALDNSLHEISARGESSKLIFIDATDYPDGCTFSGSYSQENGMIKLRLRYRCEKTDVRKDLTGKTKEEIIQKIMSVGALTENM